MQVRIEVRIFSSAKDPKEKGETVLFNSDIIIYLPRSFAHSLFVAINMIMNFGLQFMKYSANYWCEE